MTSTTNRDRGAGGPQAPAWPAVISMALGVFGLVTAEFLPASLLTPIAAELGISEGTAGQAVTATAVVGFAASLLITAAARRADRRHLLLFFSILLVASNLFVALAPGLTMLLLGRVLLGLALGGFWTMATAVTMRLVPPVFIPRALSIMFSGVSAATILAAPLGSFLGDLAGWRSVFFLAAGLGGLALVVQFITLPSMQPTGSTRLSTLVEVLARPGIGLAMASVTLVFAGHFAFFTYLRPFLEEVTDAGISAVSGILLGFGLANFLGTLLAGPLLGRSLRMTLTAAPLLLAVLAMSLVGFGQSAVVDVSVVALWGLAFGAVPVAWTTWLTRAVPDQAETAGGLLVAAIQFSIALGAAAGGVIFDVSGAAGVFSASSLALLVAGLTIMVGVRPPAVALAE